MNKRRNKLGFTLAELLIVVAIIGVLVAIAIPVFTSSLEKAREATCLSNRTSLQHMLIYGAMMEPTAFTDISEAESGSDWSTVKVILEKTGNSFTDKICPSDGVITVTRIGDTSFTVHCKKHGSSTGNATSSNASAQNFLQSVISHISDNSSTDKYKNDNIRQSFFDKNNSWPTFTYDNKTYQIEPYYGESASQNPNNTWLFAREGDGTELKKGNWQGTFAYDPISDQWYMHLHKWSGKPDTASMNFGNSVNTLHETVQSDSTVWKPVTVTYNENKASD